MTYTETHLNKFNIDQLSAERMQKALEAFNGFEQLFGREWVDNLFNGVQSPIYVQYVIELWELWANIKVLTKSDQILKRWRSGISASGVVAELRVLGGLNKPNNNLELFPDVGGGEADAAITIEGEGRVIVEISSRGLSEVLKKANKTLNKLAVGVSGLSEGKHGKVGINRLITDDEIDTLLESIQSNTIDGPSSILIKDYGILHTSELSSGGADENDESYTFVPPPRMFATHFQTTNGQTVKKGTAVIHISDDGAKEMLEAEAGQLSRTESGVVVLDVSAVVQGIKTWEPLIRRRFQPEINTRISAVLLMSVARSTKGLETEGVVLVNQYAKYPLGAKSLKVIHNLISS